MYNAPHMSDSVILTLRIIVSLLALCRLWVRPTSVARHLPLSHIRT